MVEGTLYGIILATAADVVVIVVFAVRACCFDGIKQM